MRSNKTISLAMLTLTLALTLNHSYAKECAYRLSEKPQALDNRVNVFLGLNAEAIEIQNIESISSITVQIIPFRVVLFDEPDDVLTITASKNKTHQKLFSELLQIKDVCAESSVYILSNFISGIKGAVILHIDKEASYFQFWGNDRRSDSTSFTGFYQVQNDIFVISRIKK